MVSIITRSHTTAILFKGLATKHTTIKIVCFSRLLLRKGEAEPHENRVFRCIWYYHIPLVTEINTTEHGSCREALVDKLQRTRRKSIPLRSWSTVTIFRHIYFFHERTTMTSEKTIFVRLGCRDGLSAMWPGFYSQIRRHMWVEFVDSLLCTKRFSPGTTVSPLLKNSILLDLCFLISVYSVPN